MAKKQNSHNSSGTEHEWITFIRYPCRTTRVLYLRFEIFSAYANRCYFGSIQNGGEQISSRTMAGFGTVLDRHSEKLRIRWWDQNISAKRTEILKDNSLRCFASTFRHSLLHVYKSSPSESFYRIGGGTAFYDFMLCQKSQICKLCALLKHYALGFLIAACAAARRAMGTRNGEQLT